MRNAITSTRRLPALLVACALLLGSGAWMLAAPSDHELKGWKKGRGWGWVWGKDDEVGSLNAMTPQSVLQAIGLVKQGKIYDLQMARPLPGRDHLLPHPRGGQTPAGP